jgi:pimeloyl-ACP methyl ester carboxylesterase
MADGVTRTIEQAVRLGPRQSMVGIVTPAVSEGKAPAGTRPQVVILNAGIIHRVGPNRLSVLMARALAQAGCNVMRFDLSGIGDSTPRTDGLSPLEASMLDIREALDSLASTREGEPVVLVGLCSGADHAIIYSGQDPRVAGVVLIDPSIPHTFQYHLRHYLRRAMHLRSWLNVVTGRSTSLGWQKDVRRQRAEPSGDADINAPEARTFLEQAYQRSLERGVNMLVVLTGGYQHQHNYRMQLIDAFPRLALERKIQLEYLGSADHTFESRAERTRLISMIGGWMAQFTATAGSAREETESASRQPHIDDHSGRGSGQTLLGRGR